MAIPQMQPQQQPMQQPAPAPKKKEAPQIQMPPEIIEMGQRIRMIEEKFANLRSKTEVMDSNMLSNAKKEANDIRAANEEMNEFARNINDMKDKMKMMIEELKMSAKKEEMDTIKKYLEYWQPAEFVSRKEMMNAMRELREELKRSNI
jgi:type IV secretory pathway VirB10-like protein